MRRAFCIGGAIIFMIFTTSAAPAATLRVRVTDQDGKPLPAAWIHRESSAGPSTQPVDANGEAGVQIPTERRDWLRVTAKAPGYESAHAQWWWPPRKPGDVPQASLTLPLKRGSKVGGFLKNEQGQPIAGAEVKLDFETVDEMQGNYVPGNVRHGLWRHVVRTDEQGY